MFGTVAELIEALIKVEDKSQPIFSRCKDGTWRQIREIEIESDAILLREK